MPISTENFYRQSILKELLSYISIFQLTSLFLIIQNVY